MAAVASLAGKSRKDGLCPRSGEFNNKQAEFEAVALEHFDALYNTAMRMTRN